MQKKVARGLFLADTHLGNSRTKKSLLMNDVRDSFFENFLEALKPAFEKKVDFVIHGGDLFYRSKFPEELLYMVFEPINAVAELGIPFIIVPGNHERSKIRTTLFTKHENVYIFSKPRTFTFDFHGIKIALAGFPNDRNHIKQNFRKLVQETQYQTVEADVKLLCIHQTVEGAKIASDLSTLARRLERSETCGFSDCHSCESRNPENSCHSEQSEADEVLYSSKTSPASLSEAKSCGGKNPSDFQMDSRFHGNDERKPYALSFYTFGYGDDVIPCSMLPDDFDLILSGHIHRHQILRQDLTGKQACFSDFNPNNRSNHSGILLTLSKSKNLTVSGKPLKAPVIYAGSTERCSIAENAEKKGYIILEFTKSPDKTHHSIKFHPLPSEFIIPRK